MADFEKKNGISNADKASEGADVTPEQLLAAFDALNQKMHQFFALERPKMWAGVQAAHPDDAPSFTRAAKEIDGKYLDLGSAAAAIKAKLG